MSNDEENAYSYIYQHDQFLEYKKEVYEVIEEINALKANIQRSEVSNQERADLLQKGILQGYEIGFLDKNLLRQEASITLMLKDERLNPDPQCKEILEEIEQLRKYMTAILLEGFDVEADI